MFGWVSPLMHTKEPELVDKIGLDAATFLRFLRMMRWLFTIIAIGGAVMTVPVDVIYTLKHNNKHNELTMLTVRDVYGRSLYAHVAAGYVYTGIVLFFAWKHWKAMAQLRSQWYRSPEYTKSFYARTLIVTRVPKKLQSDDGIKKIFEDLKMPYPATAVHIGRRVGQLPELIEQHNNNVRELETYLVRYLKGGKIGKKRPTIRIGGFLGMGGQKLDAIDYYRYVTQSFYNMYFRVSFSSIY
jgi:calcium permeable stress-gated cation channel